MSVEGEGVESKQITTDFQTYEVSRGLQFINLFKN